jgi:endonuclease YncB( thermonuclease family)
MTRVVGFGRAPRLSFMRRQAGAATPCLAALTAAGLLFVVGGPAAAQSLRTGDQVAGPATVVDGISFDIKSDRFRLWGVDTPERGTACYRNGRRWKPAEDAAAALRRCVGGKIVTCRVWKVERKWFRDIHVSECWTDDGLDVGECMIRSGWATDYTCYSAGYYQDLGTEAKNKGIGLWSCDNGPGTRRWGRYGRDAACETPRYKPTGPGPK